MKVIMSKSQARDYNLVTGFYLAGADIIVREDRNEQLPPLVKKSWQGGRAEEAEFASANDAGPRSVTVETLDRPEDGVIHRRLNPLTYERRPSRKGGSVVQCKSWAKETRDLERLAEALGFENLDALLDGLASDGVPSKSTCQRVAGELNRSLGSVTGKLRDLRRKALVSRK